MRPIALLAALALLLLPAFASPTAAQGPISLDEYRSVIAETISLHSQALAATGDERTQLLNRAADRLATVTAVQTDSGQSIPADNSALITVIRDPYRTEVAAARLAALQSALAAPLVTLDAAQLARLQEILNAPPFVGEPPPAWWLQILDAIQDFLSRLVSNTARGVFDLRDIFVLVAILIVVGIVLYFIRNLRRNLVPEEQLPPLLAEEDARTPAEAFDNAQRFINAGDLRSAVRQLYIATLLLLDRSGRIKYDPTLTNREYLQQASNDANTRQALTPIIDTFDRIWYGFEPISESEFETYRRRVEQVKGMQ